MEALPATEFMDKVPVAVSTETPIAELVATFLRERVRALPVTDVEGRLVGVVSESDVFLKKKGVPFSLEKVPTLLGQPVARDPLDEHEAKTRATVGDVMTLQPVCINADTTLERAAMLMLERRFSVLPVVDDERLIGMVRRIYVLRRIYGKI